MNPGVNLGAFGAGTVAEGLALKGRNAKPFVLPHELCLEMRVYFTAAALFENMQDIFIVDRLVMKILDPGFLKSTNQVLKELSLQEYLSF